MQGYVSIHRKIKEWRHYKNPAVKVVFLDLLLDAAHKPTCQSGVRLAVGECISSTRTIAQSNGLAVNTVTKALNLLIESGEIARRREGNTTIFTILNYADYQDKNSKGVAKGNTPKLGVANDDTRLAKVSQNVAHDMSESVSNDDTPVSQIEIHSVANDDTPHIINNNKISFTITSQQQEESCELRKIAIERIEKLRNQCLDAWSIEQATYSTKISVEQYKQLIEEIFKDWLFALDESKPAQPQLDAINKNHLLSVLRIKAEILKKRQNNGTQNLQQDRHVQRRGTDTSAVSKEDYEGAF